MVSHRVTAVTLSTWRRATPAALAVLVLACSVPLAWMGATPVTHACDDPYTAPDEGGVRESETSLWPPGVRCVSRFTDGTTLEATYVTWYELILALLLGAWTFLIVAAVLRTMPMRRLLAGGAAAVAVFLAATVAFFL